MATAAGGRGWVEWEGITANATDFDTEGVLGGAGAVGVDGTAVVWILLLLLLGLGGAGARVVAGAADEAAGGLVCPGTTIWPVAVGKFPV